VALAACRAGATQVSVVNRTAEKAVGVVSLVKQGEAGAEITAVGLESSEAQEAVATAEVVIDSTAVGMYPNHDVPPVVPEAWLHAGQVVCDLTYNPRETVLLQAARRQGARTLDGTGMLVHQGALALEYWTGQAAPVEAMRGALLAALARREGGG
jgi:shikimate dehydrogenase